MVTFESLWPPQVFSEYVSYPEHLCSFVASSAYVVIFQSPSSPHQNLTTQLFLPGFWYIICLPQLLFFIPGCSALKEFQVRQNKGKLHAGVLQENPSQIKADNTIPWKPYLLCAHTRNRLSSPRPLMPKGRGGSRLVNMLLRSRLFQ